METRNIIICVGSLSGGVLTSTRLLANSFSEKNISVTIIVVQQERNNDSLIGFHSNVSFIFTKEISVNIDTKKRKRLLKQSNFIVRLCEVLHIKVSNSALIDKTYSKNLYRKVNVLGNILLEQSDIPVIAMGTHANWCVLLAKEKYKCKNKVLLCERSDPGVQAKSRTFEAFVDKLYSKSDAMIFQSEYAMQWYSNRIKICGYVIYNFLREDLPTPYFGKRRKVIVNFCRISREKNIELMITAFKKFRKNHKDFMVHIFGNTNAFEDNSYYDELIALIKENELSDSFMLFPARPDVHELVKDCAMFVSSSEFEGMSNSMLESMAIGLPTICTDCPIGGARAVIKDHENGILTPVGDARALYLAMKEVIENPELADKLSKNGAKLREELAPERIFKQWEELV